MKKRLAGPAGRVDARKLGHGENKGFAFHPGRPAFIRGPTKSHLVGASGRALLDGARRVYGIWSGY